MKAIILAAGFGTRLERDLLNEQADKYKHLIGVPKPLLPIAGKPLASHWIEDLQNVPDIDGVYLVTNGKNHKAFEDWSHSYTQVKLACEGAMSNEARSGAVACMDFGVKQFNIHDDVMIIAGDTLFYNDFNIVEIIRRLKEFRKKDPHASLLVYVTCTDEEVHKYGILETDEHSQVTGFMEKPQPSDTHSRKECPCYYILSKEALPLLQQFLDERKDEPLKARDATGNFISYLYSRMPVFAVEISGRYDVGGLSSYIVCNEQFMALDSSQ